MPSYAEYITTHHTRPSELSPIPLTAEEARLHRRLIVYRRMVDSGHIGEWADGWTPDASESVTVPQTPSTPRQTVVVDVKDLLTGEVLAWGHDLVEMVSALRQIAKLVVPAGIPYRIGKVDWQTVDGKGCQANLFVGEGLPVGFNLVGANGRTDAEALQCLGAAIIDQQDYLRRYVAEWARTHYRQDNRR